MIDYIKGQLAELMPAVAVVEAAGVGYEINISLSTYSSLAGKENQETKLWVTEIIREDTHDLFGFGDKGEREIFLLLVSVSGIGANTARMILSTFTAAEVRTIVATGNAKVLSQVKGLGLKTAQRIIVDLKDKMLKVDLDTTSASELAFAEYEIDSSIKQEAVSALTMLGFAAAPSNKVVEKILKAEPTANVETVIRKALKML
ncbi:MAG: Holliday junction branch migration protein RuvA [Paludibacteraceae bacterium]|nr:Holliday junction branch migration protein RuvA [Paludibacteraceae bacterium]